MTFSYWCTGVKSDATWFRWCLKGEDWLSCLGLRWENFIRFGFSHLQLGKISAITVIGLISFVSLVNIWNDLYPPRNDHISPQNWHFWVDDVPAFPFGVICDHSLEGRFIQVVFWSVQMTQSVTALTMRTMEPLRFLLNLVPWTSIFLWMLQLDDEPNLYLGNGWKSASPSISIPGCLGFQESTMRNFFFSSVALNLCTQMQSCFLWIYHTFRNHKQASQA